MKFRLDKAVETIVYAAAGTPDNDLYKSLKAIYFADKEHLRRFGRLMFGERYLAFDHGPIPDASYAVVKAVRGDNIYAEMYVAGAREAFQATKYRILPSRAANLDLLSTAERTCLDEAIAMLAPLSFTQVKRLSHDDAYKAADRSEEISVASIIKTFSDAEQAPLASHIQDRNPGQA